MCVFVGVGDGVVEVVEQVALVGEAVECADGFEDAQVLGAGALEEHGDVAVLRARLTISPSAWAPVASSTWRSGRRRITTWTSVTAVSSVRKRCAAPKNRAPSSR